MPERTRYALTTSIAVPEIDADVDFYNEVLSTVDTEISIAESIYPEGATIVEFL